MYYILLTDNLGVHVTTFNELYLENENGTRLVSMKRHQVVTVSLYLRSVSRHALSWPQKTALRRYWHSFPININRRQ